VSRPCRSGNEGSVGDRFIHWNIGELAAGEPNVTRAGWIRRHLLTLDEVRRSKQLRRVTERGNRLAGTSPDISPFGALISVLRGIGAGWEVDGRSR
jgi:hypothetical protein